MDLMLNLLIVLIAFSGVGLTIHIYRKKRAPHPFVCPLNGDCHAVVHSAYSTLLGIPLEILGFLYYAIIATVYSLRLSQLTKTLVVNYGTIIDSFTFTLSVIAFLVSIYLTFIQIFKLRQLCTWCLISASFCVLIFISTAMMLGFIPLT